MQGGREEGPQVHVQVAAGKVTIKPKTAKVTVAFGKGLRAGQLHREVQHAGRRGRDDAALHCAVIWSTSTS